LAGVVVKRFFATLMSLNGLVAGGEAHSAATITFSQVGNDVQATLTGTLNLTGLIADGAGITPNARVRGGGLGANVILGPSTSTAATSYSVISGPQSIGCSSDTIDASSGSAGPNGPFGINMSGRRLVVRNGFVSGNNVSASATWNGATIGSLDLISGTYVYTWDGDSLTIIIPGPGGCQSVAAIPTLSEWSLLMLGLMVMTVIGWHLRLERSF
jgi:IPTL-CTERM motif